VAGPVVLILPVSILLWCCIVMTAIAIHNMPEVGGWSRHAPPNHASIV
jgi:hypothetical protein